MSGPDTQTFWKVTVCADGSVVLRELRRWLTTSARHAGLALAPRVSPRWLDRLERALARVGPVTPVLAGQVAANMRAAGVFSKLTLDSHFRQVARHLSNAVRIFRAEFEPRWVGDLARREVAVDASIDALRAVLAEGRGAVLSPPHVCNYLLTVVRLSQEVPVAVYLRWSKDERKRALKEAWCRAAGLEVILEPANAADPTSRAAACVDVLRAGKALVMTPDIVQRAGRGTRVTLLGRQVDLPSGPASIAMLAEAPLVPVFGHVQNDIHTIAVKPGLRVESLSRAQGGRSAAMRAVMQVWADQFAAFLRDDPATWFLWADSRWTRFFRGDPHYSTPVAMQGDGSHPESSPNDDRAPAGGRPSDRPVSSTNGDTLP